MKLWRYVRSRLGWRLFLSHLIVVLVGSAVLGVVAHYHAPKAFETHILRMQAMSGADQGLADDLKRSFFEAIGEILLVSGGVAAFAALLVSSFVAWRIIAPIRLLTRASRRIAAGDYGERVETQWNDEISELANSFNRMAATLEATEERRVELIGNLAHEVKTPLASIRSMMEGLIDGVLPATPQTFVEIQRETRRLQRLTDELRHLSEVESGAVLLQREACDPTIIVSQVVSRLGVQFDGKGVHLASGIPEDLPDVYVDQERIVQVLINLLGNALQYTHTGGGVAIRARREEEFVLFEVSDTGIGLAEEDLPRIFERFYRVEKSRSRMHGGSGIGLAIASHLVHAHGGALTVQSDGLGCGSTFAFTLPAVS